MKKSGVVLSIVLMVVFSTSVVQGALVRWDSTSGGNDHYYEVVCVAAGISWEEAQSECQLRDGYLATITSLEENGFVYNLAIQESGVWSLDQSNNTEGPWLGGSKVSGDWAWNTGEAFSYTAWGSRQPNGNGDYMNYYGIGSNKTDRWNDFPSDVTGYVFESAVPEPMSLILLGSGCFFLLKRRS